MFRKNLNATEMKGMIYYVRRFTDEFYSDAGSFTGI